MNPVWGPLVPIRESYPYHILFYICVQFSYMVASLAVTPTLELTISE